VLDDGIQRVPVDDSEDDEMISAWDIYWVMQLDTIRSALGVASVFALVATAMSALAIAIEGASPRYAKFFGAALAPLAIAAALVPSSKTAAAMVVLPAIANNQTIQREAGDLYGIAKDALRNLSAPKEQTK
jgi:hypothetical protein